MPGPGRRARPRRPSLLQGALATLAIVLAGSLALPAGAAADVGSTITFDLYTSSAVRYQQPDPYACVASSAMMMLNMAAGSDAGQQAGFTWHPTTAYSVQEAMLHYARSRDTMLDSSNGTDPHGWRDALNAYGWGTMYAGVYEDVSFSDFDTALRSIVTAIATYHLPVGLLMESGFHAELVSGYTVSGGDPATGATDFDVVGLFLTDPWQRTAHRDYFATYDQLKTTGKVPVKFTPYAYTDSPYRDPIDGAIGKAEWYGKYVTIEPVKPTIDPQPSDGHTARLGGGDRYATSAAISAATFKAGVPVAFIATGTDYPDALAGAAAAGLASAPVLLVGDTIPGPIAAELDRLAPKSIVVLGGQGAVSDSILAALKKHTAGDVTRLAGDDRYATAAAISAATFKPGVPIAYVATGTNFPDALAGAAAAVSKGGPVLLTEPDTLPPETAAELSRLKPKHIAVLGAGAAVSDAVLDALKPYTSGPVTRLAGTNRYGTANAISLASYPGATTVYLATGTDFPDALSGAALGGPLLLAPSGDVLNGVRLEIERLKATKVVALGAGGAVSDQTLWTAAGLTPKLP